MVNFKIYNSRFHELQVNFITWFYMEYEGLNLKAKYLKKSNGVPDIIYTPLKNFPKYAITEYRYIVILGTI